MIETHLVHLSQGFAHDACQLAAALRRLLDDPALAARLGGAARQRVGNRYDARQRARRYEAFYEELVNISRR